MDIDSVLTHHLVDHRLAHLFTIGSISIDLTMHSLMMLIAATLLMIGAVIARRQSAVAGSRGLGNAFEMVILYFRDEVVRPNLGPVSDKYLPYFLTLFFFILLCNLLGLVPYGMTATSNIAVTGGLALLTFLMVVATGIWEQGPVHFLKTFVPHGLPFWLVPFIFFIEFLGLFTKALALCIRLFANMIAGHMLILVMLCMIFMFKTIWLAPISVAGAVAISVLEVFVCFLQAYVFTLLTALFVGAAVNPQH